MKIKPTIIDGKPRCNRTCNAENQLIDDYYCPHAKVDESRSICWPWYKAEVERLREQPRESFLERHGLKLRNEISEYLLDYIDEFVCGDEAVEAAPKRISELLDKERSRAEAAEAKLEHERKVNRAIAEQANGCQDCDDRRKVSTLEAQLAAIRSLQRYRFQVGHTCNEDCHARMAVDDNGDWAMWQRIEKLLAAT